MKGLYKDYASKNRSRIYLPAPLEKMSLLNFLMGFASNFCLQKKGGIMQSINFRSITITVIVAVLCFVVLAGAEEEESQFEPKLVYEKKFDFEIAHGKIADDGSLFPTIFVTKDNRVLFFNENGKIKKTLKLTEHQFPVLSEDAKYVGVLSYPENWWKKEVDTPIELYDYTGKMLWRLIPEGEYLRDITINKDAQGIAIASWTGMGDEFVRADFYSKEGKLLKSYIAPAPFPLDSTLTTDKILIKVGQKIVKKPSWGLLPLEKYFCLGKTMVSAEQYFYSIAKDAQRSWLAVFRHNGDIVKIIDIIGEAIQEFVMSPDLKTLVYTSNPSTYQREKGNKRRMTVQVYAIDSGSSKDAAIEIVPQKARSFATLNVSADCKLFLVINGAKLYLCNIQKGEKIYDWEAPDGSLIKGAFDSPSGNYVLCSLADYRMYLLNHNGRVVFAGKTSGVVIDVRFDEYSKSIQVLDSMSSCKYVW